MIDNEALRSIEKLHEMKASGIISPEEFEAAKGRLLHGAGTQRPVAEFAVPSPSSNQHLAWMLMPLRRYAEFSGRSCRKEFWMFLLFTNLVGLALAVIGLGDTNFYGQTGTAGNIAFGLMAIGFLGVLVPLIAVEVRRFHDQGKSGWFALLNLIPYVGPLVVLVFMVLPGVDGDNEYGPDPKI